MASAAGKRQHRRRQNFKSKLPLAECYRTLYCFLEIKTDSRCWRLQCYHTTASNLFPLITGFFDAAEHKHKVFAVALLGKEVFLHLTTSVKILHITSDVSENPVSTAPEITE